LFLTLFIMYQNLFLISYYFELRSWWGVLDTALCDKVCQWLAGRWFSPGPPVSSNNKTDRHDITEILLKVALNTINLNLNILWLVWRQTTDSLKLDQNFRKEQPLAFSPFNTELSSDQDYKLSILSPLPTVKRQTIKYTYTNHEPVIWQRPDLSSHSVCKTHDVVQRYLNSGRQH
jgi:hypothetical protein